MAAHHIQHIDWFCIKAAYGDRSKVVAPAALSRWVAGENDLPKLTFRGREIIGRQPVSFDHDAFGRHRVLLVLRGPNAAPDLASSFLDCVDAIAVRLECFTGWPGVETIFSDTEIH